MSWDGWTDGRTLDEQKGGRRGAQERNARTYAFAHIGTQTHRQLLTSTHSHNARTHAMYAHTQCTHVRTQAGSCTCTQAGTHARTHARTHLCRASQHNTVRTHAHTRAHTHTHAHTHTRTHTLGHSHTHAHHAPTSHAWTVPRLHPEANSRTRAKVSSWEWTIGSFDMKSISMSDVTHESIGGSIPAHSFMAHILVPVDANPKMRFGFVAAAVSTPRRKRIQARLTRFFALSESNTHPGATISVWRHVVVSQTCMV